MGLNLEEKFWSRIKVDENDCWLWQGKLNDAGYGRIKVGKKDVRVHRLSYECYKSEIPEGLVLDHLCRVRNCANPDHLEPVTKGENTKRGNAAAKVKKFHENKTHCPQGHPYSGDNLILLTQVNGKWRKRKCRACNVVYKARARERISIQKVRR